MPFSFIIAEKENCFPCMLAKFILTATVLAGWTIAQPSTPPRPLVAKTTGFDSGGGEGGEGAVDELIVGKGPANCGWACQSPLGEDDRTI